MNGLVQFDGLEHATLPSAPLHLAIGMFDGVHLGHQSVIEAAIQSARRSEGKSGVLTFWPHPSALFRPENPTPLLMPPAMKRRVLAGMGIDFLIEQNFSRAFASIEAERFAGFLRQQLPSLAALYVGENWRFGRQRAGDVAMLIAQAGPLGISVFSAPRLNHNGTPISSSRIRTLLTEGGMAEANALLGYAYFSTGVVERGRQLGRTIGFPTLNLAWEPELKPRYGVYAVEVETANQTKLKGVASYGVRPTVETAGRPLLEVFVLEPTTLTYGDGVTVRWLDFQRPELKFDDLATLTAQIETDRQNAEAYFRKQEKN